MPVKQQCIQCHQIPQNIVVLACNHSLCSSCSAKVVQNGHYQQQFYIVCRLCKEETVVDISLYEQLQKMQSNTIQRIGQKESMIGLSQSYLSKKENILHEDRMKESLNLQEKCPYHSEYSLMYICKQCCNNLICPQCVVNGIHKNHEVLSIQKQGQKIKQQLTLMLNTLDNTLNDLQLQSQKMITCIQQKLCHAETLKSKAKNRFQELMKLWLEQQMLIIDKCDQMIDGYAKEISWLMRQKDRQINRLQQKRIDIIDMLNPFIKQNVINNGRALLKMHSLLIIRQYHHFSNKYHHHQQKLVPDRAFMINSGLMEELNQRINKISMNNVRSDIQKVKIDFQTQFMRRKQKGNDSKQYLLEQIKNNNASKPFLQRRIKKNENIFNII